MKSKQGHGPAAALLLAACLPAATVTTSLANGMRPTDILVLGDSQLAFGSGTAIHDFLDEFAKSCASNDPSAEERAAVDAMSVGVLGVRATGLHMWLSRKKRSTRMICVRDPNGLSNASTYGAMRYGGSRWAQIGESPNHQFCGKARSPLENIFAELPAPPRLVVFDFLGLSTFHWLAEGKLQRDLQRLDQQLPRETACLFLTTIPTYRASINRPRWRTQARLQAALKETGSRCRFVAGHTRTTLAAFENNPAYYRKRRNGSVRDPYHANAAGARRFLKLRGTAICRGVVQALFEGDATPPMAHLPGDNSRAQSPPLPMAIPALSLTAAGREPPD